MFDMTKVAMMTAAEAVEQSRRAATMVLSFIPNVEVRDNLAVAINLQCNLADIYAAQVDKVVSDVKKNWKFA